MLKYLFNFTTTTKPQLGTVYMEVGDLTVGEVTRLGGVTRLST